MAKLTAIIDIGSNSARMIVCKKSSRYAFHIIYEAKSRVRISEGSYNNGGYLQEFAIIRAINALRDFKAIATSLKCRKILCVATSAVRSAPNRNDFLKRVKKEIDIDIKVIDGDKEAYFGAFAAVNLLPKQNRAISIDIGGGSTELALVENDTIVKTLSLDIGTIRLKELFYDKKASYDKLVKFIKEHIKNIPSDFRADKVIAIGGTARAISKLVMPKEYPLKTIHAYEYSFEKNIQLFETITATPLLKLKKYNIKKHRLDTLREGVAIFINILKKIGTKDVITSGVGVREGVYLRDLLRSSGLKFPQNFNPSLRSLSDRFLINEKFANVVKKDALKIFDILKEKHNIEDRFKQELSVAAKLSFIGSSINYYRSHEHTFYLIINDLNYGYSHSQKLLVAFITLYQNKKMPTQKELERYTKLLPEIRVVKWLSFILALSKCIHKNIFDMKYEFKLEDEILYIKAKDKKCYLCKECIKELYKPFEFTIIFSEN